MTLRDAWNAYRNPNAGGHYESYFQRANHPARPLAFWIRYTVFVPKAQPEQAVGELWAVYFDGEKQTIAAAKEVAPLSACSFSKLKLDARIGAATLDSSGLRGSARGSQNMLAWELNYQSNEKPLLLFPERLYATRLPKAKTLVGSPQAHFNGVLTVDGQRIDVRNWVGSQNHNWGSKHTDHYAWGQVAGFDGAPEVFLECATARVKMGPVLMPPLSPAVLRIGQDEYRFSSLLGSLRAKASYAPFRWQLSAESAEGKLELLFEGRPSSFVALPYDNPPGGQKICLNSKLASCRVRLSLRDGSMRSFETKHRAAFEILGDETVPNIARLAP